MSSTWKALGALVAAVAIAGCVSHGPEGVAYSTGGPGVVGATGGVVGGSLSGSGPSEPSQGEKEKRGSAPVGMDRDGHGPAAGAILDPTGAATRGKPY